MNKLNFEFCAVPVSILKRTDFTANEKLLYSVLLGFQANGDSWASNEYLADMLGCHVNTINNGLISLEAKNAIKRNTQQINKFKKERTIEAKFIKDEHKNCVSETQKLCSHEHKNCAGTEHKNCALLDNSLLDNRLDKGALSQNFKSKYFSLNDFESSVGSGRLGLATFNFLAITLPEAIELDRLLATVKFEAINRILLHANSMGESSESKKCLSRSFSYITAAINDYKKSELIGQSKTATHQSQPTGRAEHKVFKKEDKKHVPNHDLMRDLVNKVLNKH
jgi:DNA-binding transcriptional regulator YhcF (GntR family)